MRAVRREHR